MLTYSLFIIGGEGKDFSNCEKKWKIGDKDLDILRFHIILDFFSTHLKRLKSAMNLICEKYFFTRSRISVISTRRNGEQICQKHLVNSKRHNHRALLK